MKTLLKLLAVLFLMSEAALADLGELAFIFKNASGKHGTITVAQVSGTSAWSWNASRSRVILLSSPFSGGANAMREALLFVHSETNLPACLASGNECRQEMLTQTSKERFCESDDDVFCPSVLL